LDLELTIDDPKVYTTAWTVTLAMQIAAAIQSLPLR
jgi:hypothetical protein